MPTRRHLLAGAVGVVTAFVTSFSASQLRDERVDGVRGEPGESPTPTSTATRTPVASDDDVLDVTEFGAAGDGETDDAAAIEAAIEAAEPGQTVFLPETSDSYLLSFDGTGRESALDLGSDAGLDDVSVVGERAAAGAQTLQVERGSYDADEDNWVLRIEPDEVVSGLTFRNLTIDGARPPDDGPAGVGGEASVTGVLLRRGGAGGGHDIRFENCLVRDCSTTAFRFEESGVTCLRTTALRAGRHGYNPVADDGAVDPAFLGVSIAALHSGGTGIDHRRGTARLQNVYTRNNRSGNKWKHYVERLEVVNHRSVNDRTDAWRSNHSAAPGESVPEHQTVVFDGVYVTGADPIAIRVSGTDTTVRCDLRRLEVRGTEFAGNLAAVEFLRDVVPVNPGSGRLVVADTDGGAGVYVGDETVVDVDTFDHFGNDTPITVHADGTFRAERTREISLPENVFGVPSAGQIGAFNAGFRPR